MIRIPFVSFIAGTVLMCLATVGFGQSWRAVQGANGWTWARVTFVNQSADTLNWGVSNCRAAVDSTASQATTDPDGPATIL